MFLALEHPEQNILSKQPARIHTYMHTCIHTCDAVQHQEICTHRLLALSAGGLGVSSVPPTFAGVGVAGADEVVMSALTL